METKRCTRCGEGKPVGPGGAFGWKKDKKLKAGGYWRSICKPCHADKTREWYEENREKRLESSRRYNAARRASWSDAERIAVMSVNCAIERTTLDTSTLFGGASYTDAVAFTIPFAEERLRLEAATGKPHEIDHIIPISKGGLHTPENLQVIHRHENRSKGDYWCDEDHLTDEDIERLDREALEFAA